MFFLRDIGIDLGTANSIVFYKGKGICLNEPSVVAIEKDIGKVLAVGEEAKQMIGRTPGNIVAVRPMKGGVIADFEVTYSMVKYFLEKVLNSRSVFLRPRVVICVPSGVTTVEERAVKDAALQAGAKEAYLIEEPMAAAIGAGLPVQEPIGSMIIDIGGGTTDIAVISLGGIVINRSIRIAGDKMDEAIIQYIKKNYNLMIGDRSAEEIKKNIGATHNIELTDEFEIRGRDLVSGLPKNISIPAREIQIALKDTVDSILDTIRDCLESTPPELATDIIDHGIVLVGGGALLQGLDKLIKEETGMPVHIAENPLSCVALGTGNVLGNIKVFRKLKRFD